MEESGQFLDWEFIRTSETDVLGEIVENSKETIRSDYFSVNSENRCSRIVTSEGVDEESYVDFQDILTSSSRIDCEQELDFGGSKLQNDDPEELKAVPQNDDSDGEVPEDFDEKLNWCHENNTRAEKYYGGVEEIRISKANQKLNFDDDSKNQAAFDGFGRGERVEMGSSNSEEFQLDIFFECSSSTGVKEKGIQMGGMRKNDGSKEVIDSSLISANRGLISLNSENVVEKIETGFNDFPKLQDISGILEETNTGNEQKANTNVWNDRYHEPNSNEVTNNSMNEAAETTENPMEIIEKSNEGNKNMIWWKTPFELLKLCVFRINPVWTFSIALVALMGVTMLRKKLNRLKQKSSSIPLNIIIDDKRSSQHTSRTARLNEAFSVVRRVQLIWPLFPSSGTTSWPAVTLR